MSKEAWFRQYERLEAENPELDDEVLSDMALNALRDNNAEEADRVHDEALHDDCN